MPNPGERSAMFPRSSTNYRGLLAFFTLHLLDTRTQLSKTAIRYDKAHYGFQMALAAHYRAMGKPSIEIAEVQ